VNRNKIVVQQNWIKAVQQNWNVLKQKAAFAVIPWTSCDLATEVDKKLLRRLVHWSQRFYRNGLEKELGSKVGILLRFTLGRSVIISIVSNIFYFLSFFFNYGVPIVMFGLVIYTTK